MVLLAETVFVVASLVAIGATYLAVVNKTSDRLAYIAGALFATVAIILSGVSIISSSPNPVTEDSPGWNCHTMGNGICGPVSINPDDSNPLYVDIRDGDGTIIAVVSPENNHLPKGNQ